ncbi:uncharacterized protein LOC124531361 [Vanessa cardui]|uniref:uncharacterized protein LOC124531361 n=1 Tax=Vanessa cardui TaxID=171605 RepID=UPI001F12C9E3|nr:uncharacterized protein LOC124531361 [Vanessa cardui]
MPQTKEQRLESQRLCKRRRYQEIKNDPELLAVEKEKRRKQYLKTKEEKKILQIKDRTPRSQREQRRRWKKNSKNYRDRQKENLYKDATIETIQVNAVAVPNLLNDADNSLNEGDPLQHDCECQVVKRTVRKIRYTEFKKRKVLISIIKSLKKKNESQRKTITNLRNKLEFIQNLPDEDRNKIINSKPPKERNFSSKSTYRKKSLSEIKNAIISFYCDDANSTIAAGKKEFISRNKKRMQKRYLTAPLIDLYKIFINDTKNRIHYSFFCKNRPFWVLHPKPANRDTCMCITHINMELLVSALNKASIIDEKKPQDILTTLCCDTNNTECLQRMCQSCATRHIAYKPFNNEHNLIFFQWQRVKQKDGAKIQVLTVKQKIELKPLEATSKLEEELPKYFNHIYKIINQYKAIKSLKTNLNIHEAIIHVDFSENYNLKYAKEVQSFHFGGSRQQVSLHTVVIYTHSFITGQVTPTSMCTLSPCLRHDAASIWAHLLPVLDKVIELNQFVDTIHFLSDSPSSQYRNKYMFYIISQLSSQHSNITRITWNYSEAGHGKGAPDGVGATLKRLADQTVHFGTDVGNFDQFYELMESRLENITIKSVSEEDIIQREKLIPESLKPFRGTLAVHQVLWDKFNPRITMRNMSCFLCDVGEICSHGKHLGFINNLSVNQNTNIDASVVPLKNTKSKFPFALQNKITVLSDILIDVTNKIPRQ